VSNQRAHDFRMDLKDVLAAIIAAVSHWVFELCSGAQRNFKGPSLQSLANPQCFARKRPTLLYYRSCDHCSGENLPCRDTGPGA
jgi:hypothetical protein